MSSFLTTFATTRPSPISSASTSFVVAIDIPYGVMEETQYAFTVLLVPRTGTSREISQPSCISAIIFTFQISRLPRSRSSSAVSGVLVALSLSTSSASMATVSLEISSACTVEFTSSARFSISLCGPDSLYVLFVGTLLGRPYPKHIQSRLEKPRPACGNVAALRFAAGDILQPRYQRVRCWAHS